MMSSLSSYSATTTTSNQQSMGCQDKLKSCICPKCNRFYEFYVRNGIFTGKVPLILHCKHTECEECIRGMLNKGDVVCAECQEPSIVNETISKIKVQEVFPVNFYLLGQIYYCKPNHNDLSNLSLKPAGVSYKNHTRSSGMPMSLKDIPQDLFQTTYSSISDFKEKCCQSSCKKSACVQCFQCSEVYCESCCEAVHKVARGLQVHKITSLTNKFVPELTKKCDIHSLSLEFKCNTCETVVCCYCIVHDHSGHTYYQLSFLNDDDRPNFVKLIQHGEEKLKKLLVTFKKVNHELANNNTKNVASTEAEIGKYFANIHAKLQYIEKNLYSNILEAKNYNISLLNDINSELCANIINLSGLLTAAKNVMCNSNTEKKLDIPQIIQRLENVLGLPCYLVGQHDDLEIPRFQHGDLLDNLESNFCISLENGDPFHLVNEDGIPDDFDTSLPDNVAAMSLDDINEMISNRTGTTPSHQKPSQKLLSPDNCLGTTLNKKSDGSSVSSIVENWLQDTATEMNKLTTDPSFKIEDRENVIVTHLVNPESFYVQLARFNKELYNMSREIEQHVRNFAPAVKDPELNKLYIVKFDIKNTKPAWYRGRIIDIIVNPNDQLKQYCIQFIDYGNTSIVSRNMLREINSVLLKPKPFAIHCKLMNIYPFGQDWSSKAIKLMAQIVSSEVIMVVMNKSEGIFEVDLISMPHYASVRDALIFVGDAAPCLPNPTSLTEFMIKNRAIVSKLHHRSEHFTKGQTVDVYISHVIDPHNVYVQMADFAHHIAHLNRVMTNYYSNKSNRLRGNVKHDNIYVPQKGMIVAVKYTEELNTVWYRGTVTKTYDGQGMVDIFLVDVGKSVTVSYTQIRKLLERFYNLECQAILVKMVHIEPIKQTWDHQARDCLNKYVLQKNVVRMLVYDPVVIPIEVLLFEHYSTMDICINALLVRNAIAQASLEVSLQVEWIQEPPTLKKDTPFVFDLLDTIQSTNNTNKDNCESEEECDTIIVRKPINILVTKSPNLIYVAFNDEEAKHRLKQLEIELQNYYSTHDGDTQSWQAQDPCVVFNKLDGLYYRGIILEKCEGNTFQVLLRDTGKDLTVKEKHIYVLENEFKHALEGAIRCHLGGITPTGGDPTKWSMMSIEFLQNIFQENDIFMSKNGPVDKERKSLSVEMWFSKFKPGTALEPSRIVYHSINNLLAKNGLAFKSQVSLNDQQHNNGNKMRKRAKANKKKENSTNKEPLTNVHNMMSNNENDASKSKNVPENSPVVSGEVYCSSDVEFISPTLQKPISEYHEIEDSESPCSNEFTAAVDRVITTSLLHDYTSPNIPTTKTFDWNEDIDKNLENKVIDWLPPVDFMNTSFYAYATFVDDNAHIYLHDQIYEQGLREMEKQMKKIFDILPPEPKGIIWVPGQICTVKYFVTDSWYRGKILTVADDYIKIFMVDYGNVEECKHEDLRFKVMYTNLPAFASKIQLYKVFPKNDEVWLTSDLDELHRNVVDQKVYVTLQDQFQPGDVKSAIVKIGQININEWIISNSSNLAPVRSEPYVIQNTADVVIEGEYSDNEEMLTNNPKFVLNSLGQMMTYTWKPLIKTLEKQKVPVGIVNILNFDKLIIEFVNDADMETKALFETISKDVESKAHQQPLLSNIQVGQACVAQFSEDGKWYRAQIYNIDNIEEKIVDVWFVDFGNFENVQICCIRDIQPEWLQLPVQQYISQIFGIQLADEAYLNETLNELSLICSTIKTAEIISIEPLLVQLYEDNDELCYKNLIQSNLVFYNK